jgi:hypothetical protein
MNERIRELIKQAGGIGYDDDGNELTPVLVGKELEKFTELIVRECASICELNGQSYTHSFTPAKARLAESTSNHCGLMIKKHFGVQE